GDKRFASITDRKCQRIHPAAQATSAHLGLLTGRDVPKDDLACGKASLIVVSRGKRLAIRCECQGVDSTPLARQSAETLASGSIPEGHRTVHNLLSRQSVS